MFRRPCVVVTCLVLFPVLAGTAAAVEVPSGENPPHRQMIREINRVRAAHGLGELSRSQPLRSASLRYARWLVGHLALPPRRRHAPLWVQRRGGGTRASL